MSATNTSLEYFDRVAEKWDRMQAGYFGESLREAAISKAYLRPEYVVADVGAGTGYLTSGIAPLVNRVFVLDSSPAMLDIARKNLVDFQNIAFQVVDGLSIPLPDESLDAVFANMYLHHCQEPSAAIKEMSRLLRPGGRLILVDMEAHDFPWLREEMADIWQGFEHKDVRSWFQQAGLVNLIVESTGEKCRAESEIPGDRPPEQRQAQIGAFVAVGTQRLLGAREAVQAGYAATAQANSACCPGSSGEQTNSCCSPSIFAELIPIEVIQSPQYSSAYSPEVLLGAPKEAVEFSLGCGNPLAFANLNPGEVVVDIGSGGGIDAFLVARQVGAAGRVIGVDMTPAMLERARATAQKAGYLQVEFRQGQAEALPVDDGSVDVVISNCVINLCEDKGQVFQEAYRVLINGGRLEVSDVVTSRAFPRELAANSADWAGCVFGALPEREYLDLIGQAGFQEIVTRRSSPEQIVPGVEVFSIVVSARKL